MVERTIIGVVLKWSQIYDEKKVVLTLDKHQDTYIFFADKDKLEKLISDNPIGTMVEFIQTQNGQYWNYKKGTFVKKGNILESQKKEIMKNVDEKDIRIVRQNAMSHASALIEVMQREGVFHAQDEDVMVDKFFELARKCEEWVLRK